MIVGLIIFVIGLCLASILVIAAGVLSSHNNPQPISEEYEAMLTTQNLETFTARTYPIELNA